MKLNVKIMKKLILLYLNMINKNIKNNLKELEKNIKKSEVDKKTEKIYLNNFISRRVVDSLENMRKKDFQIFKFNKIITALGNSSK